MDLNLYIGTWEVIGCGYIIGGPNDNRHLEGVRFRLDEAGDVTWTVPDDLKSMPLFDCDTYELYCTSGLNVIIRFGAFAGHVLEFKCDSFESRDKIIITCEGWVMLHCKRIYEVASDEDDYETPFSLLPALEGGYFSDISIAASNKKEFKAHLCILQLQGSGIDWKSDPPPFNNLREDVLGTILHYLYAECLPENLSEATARLVIDVVTPYASLTKLSNKCKLYLKNMAIKQQIIGLVNDMHNCMDQIIEHFNRRTCIISNPGKLCFVVKQSIRDATVVGTKLLLLCDLFTHRKTELTKQERHEIIRYAKSRLPIFLIQLQGFLQGLKDTFGTMAAAQRLEVATFLVPEIEIILDTISTLIDQIVRVVEQIINVLANDSSRNNKSRDMLGKCLRNALHVKELSKLRRFHDQMSCIYLMLINKQENFAEMSSAQKVRSIARTLEQLIEELPVFLLRLGEVTTAFDEKLEWREFKFCFKVTTSKVSSVLQKLVTHRDVLQEVMTQLCELVQRDAFHQSLLSLGLLDAACATSTNVEVEVENTSSTTPKYHACRLNLVESLSIPPPASASLLSKLLIQQLKDATNTDMEFEIVTNTTNVEPNDPDNTPDDDEKIIKAHRVIVAARCDWIRRALLSGMRESIDKKIIIHDTSPQQFRLFLDYLYSGKLNQSVLCTEQLVELLLLSDRYEVDSLKQNCEYALKSSIDLDSALYFLSMADQYNANILRNSCLEYVVQHQELAESEIFFELPVPLQAEVFDRIWASAEAPARNTLGVGPLLQRNTNASAPERRLMFQRSESDSLDEPPLPTDTTRMEQCLTQLRDIIPGASQEELAQVVLAADYNLCRAINFYYSQRSVDDDDDGDAHADAT